MTISGGIPLKAQAGISPYCVHSYITWQNVTTSTALLCVSGGFYWHPNYCLLLYTSLMHHPRHTQQQSEQKCCPINLKLKSMHLSNAPVTFSTTNDFSHMYFLHHVYTALKRIFFVQYIRSKGRQDRMYTAWERLLLKIYYFYNNK